LRRDDIAWVDFADSTPPFALKNGRRRGRRAQGLRYEKKAHAHFREEVGEEYVESPWLIYRMKGNKILQWAQPDSLIVSPMRGIVTVCEMKYQHTADAYWQLVGKYLPLLQVIFGLDTWKFATVEIVKWYDCATDFPTSVILRDDILRVRPGEFGVHIWKP